MLEWGVNNLLKKKVVRFSTGVPVEEIIAHLIKGGGVVLSGKFKLKSRTLNHIVSLAGFITDENEDITHLIIDDPYCNFRTEYTDYRGNNVAITKGEFITILSLWGMKVKNVHI